MNNTVLGVFFQHSKKHWAYIVLMLFSLFTAGAGLSSVLIINQAALDALAPGFATPSYQVQVDQPNSLTLNDYASLRQAGAVDSIAMAKTTQQINGEALDIVGIDLLPLLNSAMRGDVERYSQKSNVTFNTAVMSASAARLLDLKEGESWQLPSAKTTPPLAIGDSMNWAVEGSEEAWIIMPLTDYIKVLELENAALTSIFIFKQRSEQQLDRLKEKIPLHINIKKIIQSPDNLEMGKSFSFHLVAMGGLMTIVSFFIVTNALTMLMAFRHDTLTNLHRLGISRHTITLSLMAELIIYSLIGAGLGILFGFWAMTTFDTGISSTLSNLLRAPFSLNEVSFVGVALLCLGLCGVGMALAAILPIRQALSLEAKSGNMPPMLSMFVLVLVGGALSFGLFHYKTKLGDLAGLGTLILACCLLVTLLMPNLLSFLAKRVSPKFVLAHWSLSSAKSLANRCKLAASAYFIALVCAIGLSGMVDSFRVATDQWLTQRLAAPAYLYAEEPEKLGELDGVDMISRRKLDANLDNKSLRLNDYPLTSTYQQSMVFWSATPDVWNAFAKGEAILLNQQFALRNNIEVGQSYPLNLGDKIIDVAIAGIYYDYGNPRGQGLIAPFLLTSRGELDNVIALFPNKENFDWKAFEKGLATQSTDVSFLRKEGLLELSMRTFDNTFVLTDLLTVIALVVAAVSFAITIGLLSRHLRQNLSTLSSLGVNFHHIQRAVFMQFALICLIVSLMAIPVGISFAYLLINTVNVNAFGWTYPLELSSVQIGSTVLSGFGLMLIVCAFALRRVNYAQVSNGFAGIFILGFTFMLSGCADPPRESIFASVTSQDELHQYEQVSHNVPLLLPDDHAPHPGYQLEWWYFTSVLRDEAQRPYPFQYTLFRFNQQGSQRYMAHASLHTPEKHYFEERFAESGLPYINTTSSPFFLQLDDWQWQGSTDGQPFPAALDLAWFDGPSIKLSVTPYGPYVLHGDKGLSVKSADKQHISYYYSQPFLNAQASFLEDGKETLLSGNAWYDHEWTSQLVTQQVDGWDWFSLHMASGDKIMVFRLRIENEDDYFTGSYITADGKLATLNQEDFVLIPEYTTDGLPLKWSLNIPKQNVDVILSAFKAKQWNCGLFVYYEGGLTVTGTESGEGFMELTGYPRALSGCDD